MKSRQLRHEMHQDSQCLSAVASCSAAAASAYGVHESRLLRGDGGPRAQLHPAGGTGLEIMMHDHPMAMLLMAQRLTVNPPTHGHHGSCIRCYIIVCACAADYPQEYHGAIAAAAAHGA